MRDTLERLYSMERARLAALADADTPAGEYASPVFGDGDSESRIVLIGEAPGAEETKQGRPFVGKAGKQLDELLHSIGIRRSMLFITNAVKYRPVVRSERTCRNRTPGRAEIVLSLPLLRAELEALCPAVIVTLGNTPLHAVQRIAGEAAGTVGELHGAPHPIRLSGRDAVLFPLYHPASGIYNRALVEVMQADAVRLGEHLVKRL